MYFQVENIFKKLFIQIHKEFVFIFLTNLIAWRPWPVG